MDNKIIIDPSKCKKQKLSPEEVLIALAVGGAPKYDEVFQNMLNREIIVKQGDKYLITQNWANKINEILCDSLGIIGKEEELLAFAEELRMLFPEGKQRRPDYSGTKYFYRCNRGEVVQSLKRFTATFGNYSFEDIKNATERYVASFKGNYENMRIIKYFIIKDERIKGGDIISDLATYLDNKEEGATEVTDDWLMNPRN